MKIASLYLVWIVTFIVQVGMVSNTTRVRTFTLFKQKYTWNEAQDVCDQFGQSLLTIKNPEEVTVFQIIAEKWKTDGYLTRDMWTGLYDREQDDASVAQYRWQGDCSPLGSSTLWHNNEPNHQDVDFCVRLDRDDFQIRTTKCNMMSCVVCQKEEDECPFETLEGRLITETHVNVSSQDVASCQRLCRTTDAGDTECAACDYTPSLSLCRMAMRSTLYIGEEQPATSASASSTVHIKRCFIGIYNPATQNIVANNDTKANGRCNASTTTSTVTPSPSSTATTAYSINTSNAAVTTDTNTTTVAASTATTFPSITTATATTVAATATTAAATTTATHTTTTASTSATTAAASTDTTYLATTTSASGPTVALTNSTTAATASTGIGIVTTSADTFSAAVTTPPTAISATTTTTTTTATAATTATTTSTTTAAAAAAAASTTADPTTTAVIPSVITPTLTEPTNHDSSTTVLTTNTTLGLVNGLQICNSSVRGAVCICRNRETLFDWKEEQKLLHLKKKLLSSYRRSKTSVADDRPSAISIGTIGTTVIISVVLAVASTDFYRCCVGLFQLKRAIFK